MAKTTAPSSSQETNEKKKTTQVKLEHPQDVNVNKESIKNEESTLANSTQTNEDTTSTKKRLRAKVLGASKHRSSVGKTESKSKSKSGIKTEDGEESSSDIVGAIVGSIKKAGQKKSEFQKTEGKRFLKSFASKFGASKLSVEESTFILDEMWNLSHSESNGLTSFGSNGRKNKSDDEEYDNSRSIKIKRQSRKSEERDKNAPKKPKTSYILFSNAKTEERKKDGSYYITPEGSSEKAFILNSKLMGKLWKKIKNTETGEILNPEEYKIWKDKADADKERYQYEMEEYKKKNDLLLGSEGERIVEEEKEEKEEEKPVPKKSTKKHVDEKKGPVPAPTSKTPTQSSVHPTKKKVEATPKRKEPASKTVPSRNQEGIKAPKQQPLKLPQYPSRDESTQDDEDLMDEEAVDFPTSDTE